MKVLDVCCGRWGWSKAFAARGHQCIGIDLLEHEVAPENCKLIRMNILALTVEMLKKWEIDFVVASTPCEEFSVFGMRNFHPDPPYPEHGIKLFHHTQALCRASKVPYVMENVRSAVHFVGNAVHNCGPFYLWGNAVPMLLPQGIRKGKRLSTGGYRTQHNAGSTKNGAAIVAQIPPELANCVADYAERIVLG